MTYVDAFVASVPSANRKAYEEHAKSFAPLFKQHGALAVVDAWGDDVPEGKLTSFPLAVQRQGDETVVFGWVTWPDRATRDAAWAKLMNEPRMTGAAMPFDGKRMIFGGFEIIAQA
jgi:uncharacterized protein YbaA (DUF1428 family)